MVHSKTYTAKLAIVALAVATGLLSCKKDNGVGPSSSVAKISFGLKADNASIALASTGGLAVNSTSVNAAASLINWTEGTANVNKFQFEAKKAGIKTEIEVSGSNSINLFAVSPLLFPAKIDTGTYSEIEIRLALAAPINNNIPLQLKGTFTKADGTVIPVELNVNEAMVLKTEVKNVVIDATTDLKTTFTLHLNKIFSGITAADLSSAILTSGVIVISSTSNTMLFNKAKANVVSIGGHEIEGEHHGHNGSDDGGGHESGDDHGGD
ncbi:hypothetical protein [Mucilaginibacter gossypii]|uniref:DUF4382 domain-containing protein n=1 Tax=Mucilaginibacter gossypii TaxID=551996 RepID=A0A1G8N436_9SPHI|nr:hypothetical protein [Mucilaginibacter gossypii]SDI75039.1 hypothetical protein SAMN05192573_13110 [Mucilaginibacter gossypii]